MASPARRARAYWPHVVILLGFVALFCWLFSRFFFRPLYIAESDLYENGLPIFLSPIWIWSSYEFSGLPVLADPANFTFYPLSLIFGHVVRSWTALVMSGPLLGACLSYLYVFHVTRSKTAAVFSAAAWGLSEEMLERLRHINHVHVIAWVPLIMLALDKLQAQPTRRWVAGGAFAVGCCILAGHPQPAIYAMYCAGLYALVGLIAHRSGWRNWLAIAGMFVLGGLLAAVKGLPLAEASAFVVRSEGLSFERFVGPSLTGPQLLTFVYPTILHPPITELPTYVGLATLVLALAGLRRWRSNWRIPFWAVMALLGVVLAMGTETPLPAVAFHVPLYSWFRDLSRHLFLFAFGASVLAGFGLAALQRGELTRQQLRVPAGILVAVMGGGALLLATLPDWFPLEDSLGGPGPGPLAVLSNGIWIQVLVLVAVLVVIASMVRRPSRVQPAILIAILVADLLNALPYDIKPDGIEYAAARASELNPSVHALAIGRDMEPTHSRALAIGGTQLDDLLPATFARVWRIPIAGGYGAMLINRVSQLAIMGTNGEVRPDVLADADASLDILAVRYVIVNRDRMDDPVRRKWLTTSARWREVRHFATSRQTDRGADESVYGEMEVQVFENLRALPRAWVVTETVQAAGRPAIETVRYSRMPDGQTFDPRSVAIVDPDDLPETSRFAAGPSAATVTTIGDGRISLRVSTTRGGFLVLSENAYPGWHARVDGVDTPVHSANYSMLGVVVPAGSHRVEFSMESRSLRLGGAISGAAALTCLLLLIPFRRRRAASSDKG